jgi:hypothetical protein
MDSSPNNIRKLRAGHEKFAQKCDWKEIIQKIQAQMGE